MPAIEEDTPAVARLPSRLRPGYDVVHNFASELSPRGVGGQGRNRIHNDFQAILRNQEVFFINELLTLANIVAWVKRG
jgi:hypothetical protein